MALWRVTLPSRPASAAGTPFWAGIGAYRLSATATAANIRAARRAGAAGVLLYSYDGLMDAARPPGSALAALRWVLLESAPGSPAGRD